MSRLTTVLLTLIVLATSGCGGGTLKKKDLQKQFEAIQSLAAEGALVADGAADDRTTDVFVRVHTEYLSKAAQKVESQVSSSKASPSLASDKAKAVRLAGQVEEDLRALHGFDGDQDLARRLSEHLQRLAADAEQAAT